MVISSYLVLCLVQRQLIPSSALCTTAYIAAILITISKIKLPGTDITRVKGWCLNLNVKLAWAVLCP